MTTRRLPAAAHDAPQQSATVSTERHPRLQPLFLASAAIRVALAAVLVLGAVYVLSLLGTSDLVAWLLLALTTAGMALVLLDHAFDLEGKVAEQVAQAAVFEADAFGARAEAVRSYADQFLRIQGRIPAARARIRQPDNNGVFRVHFPSRRTECRRWCTQALLASMRGALRFVVVVLAVVGAAQLYFLLVS
jgi:hypothetical protein